MNDKTLAISKRFMSDDRGNPSAMRLMSILALIVAAIFAAVQIYDFEVQSHTTRSSSSIPRDNVCAESRTEVRKK